MRPRVLIMMPVYNGAQFLSEQLDSIFKQEDVDVWLAIRDDCSSDESVEIIRKYSDKYPGKIKIIKGEKNLGPTGCVYELMHSISFEGFDYYSFADQDDVWLPQKLSVAIIKLKELHQNEDLPQLYLSNLSVTDEKLNFRFFSYAPGYVTATPERCFAEYAASANTFVFNRAALNLYLNSTMRANFAGDVWFYILCVFLGKVVYDPESYILFRRSENNASGRREKGIKLWLYRFSRVGKDIRDGHQNCHDMAEDILKDYGELISGEKKEILEIVASYPDSLRNRLKLLFDPRIKSKCFSKNICFWGRVLINRF